ncbi:hypothetical protein [Spirillospora sp. NPDC047279]|uniref:hypothetical protein n=1 Tax=Spirillospora sp. NPDC047279 TaxID=3155478 RepID=UPI0034095C5F
MSLSAEGPVLRLRPERRSALVTVPVLLAGPALLVVGAAQPSSTALLVGLGLTGYTLRDLVIMAWGFTEGWPDCLRNRLAEGRTEVAWETVERLVIMHGLFGRHVRMEARNADRVSLAAPRTGLITRSPDFDAELLALRAMPGGNRGPLHVQTAASAPLIAVQVLLLLGFVGAVLIAVLT